ncbi:hypothetical protein HHI36_014845 [Cryptolaemus montrouzieri]|uniref:Uncharacterized protein n=1 Tax=Cryptolaemus montrouzieri TaxID=559131 RepID=A0ABD2N435_9CUCU
MANESIDLTIAEKCGLLLPKFSGVENKLHSFIKSAEQYPLMFTNENKLAKNYCFAVVKSKLIDRALAEDSTFDIPDRWETLKNFLNLKFGVKNLDPLDKMNQKRSAKEDQALNNNPTYIKSLITRKLDPAFKRINSRDIDKLHIQDNEYKHIYHKKILKQRRK